MDEIRMTWRITHKWISADTCLYMQSLIQSGSSFQLDDCIECGI